MPDNQENPEAARLRQQLERHHWMLEAHQRALQGLIRQVSGEPQASSIGPAPQQKSPRHHRSAGLWHADFLPWWPAMPWPDEVLQPSPGFACATLAGFRAGVIAVSVFGLRGSKLSEAVDLVSEVQRRTRRVVPVFLTDSPNQRAFAKHGYVCEYFPSSVYRSQGGKLDRDKVDARLRLVMRKWNVSSSLDLSRPEDRGEGGGTGTIPDLIRSAASTDDDQSGETSTEAHAPPDLSR